MATESGSEKPNLANLLSAVFTAIILIGGVIGVFTNIFGFNLDQFGDATDYFPPLHATTEQKDYYKVYDRLDLLQEAADCDSTINTNGVADFQKIVSCYRVNHEMMPKIYGEIDSYNKMIGVITVVIIALWIGSIWVIRWSIISRVQQAKSSDELNQTVSGLKAQMAILEGQIKKKNKPRK